MSPRSQGAAIVATLLSSEPVGGVLENYNVLGVGAHAEGIIHAVDETLGIDVGLGEARVEVELPDALVASAGYQYGGNIFIGIQAKQWFTRLGVRPNGSGVSYGIGVGAPLLPMPALVTFAGNRIVAIANSSSSALAAFEQLCGAGGPFADAVSTASPIRLGAGAQFGFAPEDLGIYGFVGFQSAFEAPP